MSEEGFGSNYMQSLEQNAASQIEKVFEEYKFLLKDKTHPDNQTTAYHQNVKGTINRVMSAAHELDKHNPGQGIFALFALLLSSNLKLKDKMIEVEFENKTLKKEIAMVSKRKVPAEIIKPSQKPKPEKIK